MGGAATTTRFIVAVLNNPPGSVARTTNALVPTSLEIGVPLRLPLLATLNQAGPLALAKVIGSPLGSLALAAKLDEYNCPAFALAMVNGLVRNVGGRFVTAR